MLIFTYGDDYFDDREQVEYILKLLAGFDGNRSFLKHGMKANVEVIGDSDIMAFLRDNNYAKYMRNSSNFSLEGKCVKKSVSEQSFAYDLKTGASFLRKVVDDNESQVAIDRDFIRDYLPQEFAGLSQLVVIIPSKMLMAFLTSTPFVFEKGNVLSRYMEETYLKNGVTAYDNLMYNSRYVNTVAKTFRNPSPVQYANRRVQDLRDQRQNENEVIN